MKHTTATAFRGDHSRFGVYGFGGCDVWAIAEAAAGLQKYTAATGAAFAAGRAQFTHSDLILQSWEGVDLDEFAEVRQRLHLDPAVNRPVLFESEFTIPDLEWLGSFPKNVVVLSISSDLVRTLYRQREHGFLVDPGGFWLTGDIAGTLGDLDTVKWFGSNFEKLGKISLEASMANLSRIVSLLRTEVGAEVVVFNSLTVDPGRQVLDYQLSHSPHRTRRREFALALVDLAAELNFSIIDVDRIVKGVGVSGLGDFVKFMPMHKRAIASEFVHVLYERAVFDRDECP
ncbi:MAG: hypothetical protein ABFR53_09650 [Actinomycetota bacterium]